MLYSISVNSAVNDFAESIVIVAGFVEPLKSPPQMEKLEPFPGTPSNVTIVPDAYDPPEGLIITDPVPVPRVETERMYIIWVKDAVTVPEPYTIAVVEGLRGLEMMTDGSELQPVKLQPDSDSEAVRSIVEPYTY